MIGAALLSGLLQTHAAAAAKTNWVQLVNLKLEVWQASTVKATALTTKSIVTALGGGATAKLLVKESAGNTLFLLRAGTTDTDVTSHFVIDNGTEYSSTTGTTTTKHRLDTFHFDSATLKFALSGLTTEIRAPAVKNGPAVTKSLTAKLAGEGIVGAGTNNNAIIDGTIATSGGKLE